VVENHHFGGIGPMCRKHGPTDTFFGDYTEITEKDRDFLPRLFLILEQGPDDLFLSPRTRSGTPRPTLSCTHDFPAIPGCVH
jgi:hypothetical protein